MARTKIRKCLHCQKFFQPEPRSRKRQRFCSETPCQRASKKASQVHWLSKPENRDYFRGPLPVERVQAWRKKHPGYSRLKVKPKPLKEVLIAQPSEIKEDSGKYLVTPLQDVLSAQLPVLIGLIAKFTGSTLQDDIAIAAHHLKQLGADVLNEIRV